MEFACDYVTILEGLYCCFVAVDGICCREMLAGGAAEVQVRDPCTLTQACATVFRNKHAHFRTAVCANVAPCIQYGGDQLRQPLHRLCKFEPVTSNCMHKHVLF